MKRPELKNFFPESTTSEDIQKIFRSHPELYQYIFTLDAYVDWLESRFESEIEETCHLCESSDQLLFKASFCKRCNVRNY